jgi:hypothetical protein
VPIVVKIELRTDTSAAFLGKLGAGLERSVQELSNDAKDLMRKEFSSNTWTGALDSSFNYKTVREGPLGFTSYIGISSEWAAGPKVPTRDANPPTRYVVPLDRGAAPALLGKDAKARLTAWAVAHGIPPKAMIAKAKMGTLKRVQATTKWEPKILQMLRSKGLIIIKKNTGGP